MITVRCHVEFEDALATTAEEAVRHLTSRLTVEDEEFWIGKFQVNMMNNTGWKYYVPKRKKDE